MKRFLYLLLLLSLLLSAFAAPAYAEKDKVDVCHVDGQGNYRLISVAKRGMFNKRATRRS